jgi:thiol:disulfide interchange protein DsbA
MYLYSVPTASFGGIVGLTLGSSLLSFVELLYFFWYGCPTCQMIDDQVSQMAATLPEGVRFLKLPAVFELDNDWGVHANLFWALENMGVEKDLHTKVFYAVQGEPGGGHGPLRLLSPESQKTFAKANKLNMKDFDASLKAPFVKNQLQRTVSYLDAVELASVPSFIVNGRYIVSIESRRPIEDFFNEAARLAKEELAKANQTVSPSGSKPPASSPAK